MVLLRYESHQNFIVSSQIRNSNSKYCIIYSFEGSFSISDIRKRYFKLKLRVKSINLSINFKKKGSVRLKIKANDERFRINSEVSLLWIIKINLNSESLKYINQLSNRLKYALWSNKIICQELKIIHFGLIIAYSIKI